MRGFVSASGGGGTRGNPVRGRCRRIARTLSPVTNSVCCRQCHAELHRVAKLPVPCSAVCAGQHHQILFPSHLVPHPISDKTVCQAQERPFTWPGVAERVARQGPEMAAARCRHSIQPLGASGVLPAQVARALAQMTKRPPARATAPEPLCSLTGAALVTSRSPGTSGYEYMGRCPIWILAALQAPDWHRRSAQPPAQSTAAPNFNSVPVPPRAWANEVRAAAPTTGTLFRVPGTGNLGLSRQKGQFPVLTARISR